MFSGVMRSVYKMYTTIIRRKKINFGIRVRTRIDIIYKSVIGEGGYETRK